MISNFSSGEPKAPQGGGSTLRYPPLKFSTWNDKPKFNGKKLRLEKTYKVQRRSSESWDNISTAILTEVTLVDQPEKIQLEYRVIEVNKSGKGQASNIVMVALWVYNMALRGYNTTDNLYIVPLQTAQKACNAL